MFTIKYNFYDFDQLIEALKAYYNYFYSAEHAKQGIEALEFLKGCAIADAPELLEGIDFAYLADMILYMSQKNS